MKIEEWPSRVKWGQEGPNRAKWCQTGSHRAKWGQTGPKKAKKSLAGLNVAKRANRAKRGQMGSYGLIYEIKKSYLATQALRQKLAELWGFC